MHYSPSYVILCIYLFQKTRFDRLQNFEEIEPIDIAFHKLCSGWIDQAPISWLSPYYASLGCLTVNTIVASYISFDDSITAKCTHGSTSHATRRAYMMTKWRIILYRKK
jgi:hypothetical protein